MKANAICLHVKDNVVTVVEPVKKGEEVSYFLAGEKKSLVAKEDIPACNKIAIVPIQKEELVIKYGEIIGGATEDIPLGHYVSHLNIKSLPRDYASELN